MPRVATNLDDGDDDDRSMSAALLNTHPIALFQSIFLFQQKGFLLLDSLTNNLIVAVPVPEWKNERKLHN
eukprot:SAG31_NODE_3088_length_4690_cov_2.363973_5_plen_70_part_00